MKAYVIAVADIKDQDGYLKDYAPRAMKAIEAAGGKFLVRGGRTAGASPPKGRVIVTVFDSLEKAETFGELAHWQELLKAGAKYATITSYAVEGLA